MITEEKRLWAIAQLQQKSLELGEPPKKSDFDSATVCRIKAFLGPWPRALETAGLKVSNHKDDGNASCKDWII